MILIELFFKVKAYFEEHKTLLDLSIGASIGAGTGVNHYWEHFKNDELYKLIDGALGTSINTIIGAVLLWGIHKYIFKSKR